MTNLTRDNQIEIYFQYSYGSISSRPMCQLQSKECWTQVEEVQFIWNQKSVSEDIGGGT